MSVDIPYLIFNNLYCIYSYRWGFIDCHTAAEWCPTGYPPIPAPLLVGMGDTSATIRSPWLSYNYHSLTALSFKKDWKFQNV